MLDTSLRAYELLRLHLKCFYVVKGALSSMAIIWSFHRLV